MQNLSFFFKKKSYLQDLHVSGLADRRLASPLPKRGIASTGTEFLQPLPAFTTKRAGAGLSGSGQLLPKEKRNRFSCNYATHDEPALAA